MWVWWYGINGADDSDGGINDAGDPDGEVNGA